MLDIEITMSVAAQPLQVRSAYHVNMLIFLDILDAHLRVTINNSTRILFG